MSDLLLSASASISSGLCVTAVLAEMQSCSHAWYDQARAWVDLAALF